MQISSPIIITMVVSGIAGGIANNFLSVKREDLKWYIALIKYCVLGIVASFVVPLFLNMISSNIVETAQSNFTDLLVFAGFCLIASVFSRNFLENVYDKVMRKVNNIEHKVDEIQEASTEPDETINDICKSVTNEKQKRIIASFKKSNYVFRSYRGLSQELKFQIDELRQHIDQLIKDGYIIKKTRNDGRELIRLSSIGLKLRDKM